MAANDWLGVRRIALVLLAVIAGCTRMDGRSGVAGVPKLGDSFCFVLADYRALSPSTLLFISFPISAIPKTSRKQIDILGPLRDGAGFDQWVLV